MNILKVIHGYPALYNAGSEVYSQTICHSLVACGHEVHVFTREENPFQPDGSMRTSFDADEPSVKLHLVNNARMQDRYQVKVIDRRFAELLNKLRPDIVHIGHLNHLSTSLVIEAKKNNIPVVYTLHDYWLMCPRGQFMQSHCESGNLWAACDGQEDKKCAVRCYARNFSGDDLDYESDVAYWKDWVKRRMQHIRNIVSYIDLFISPSRYLQERYENDFGLPKDKSVYLDYGFDHARLAGRKRIKEDIFTFGYIGTHIPAKGIHQLIKAFGMLKGAARLCIWGRDRGNISDALKDIANSLPPEKMASVEWMPEYKNQKIVQDVFNKTDVVVVPSIWVENSPLVIHEAQQARVPVITANIGGMKEYVRHNVNGLTFEHRNHIDLAKQMQRFLDNPDLAGKLGKRGYLYSKDGDVPDINQHISDLLDCYARVMS